MTRDTVYVIKRDGTKEPFSIEKVRRVLHVLNMPKIKADRLESALSHWLKKENTASVSSLAIRDEVQKHLDMLHKPAGDLFKWYQKTKDL